MKKIILLTFFFLIQSYPSLGNVNGKGLICKCSQMILKSRHGQETDMDHECQFLVPIYFRDNKVFIKEFKIIRDEVLLKEFPLSPNWYSDQYSITWSFNKKDLKDLGLGNDPDFTEFHLSRKNLILKESLYFGGNINSYVKNCSILSSSKFFNKLKTLKRKYQKEYNQKMIKNKI